MRSVLILLGLLTVVGSAWAVPREYSAAILFRSDSMDVMNIFSLEYDSDRDVPLSLRAVREVSSACMNVSASLFFLLQPTDTQTKIQANCADFAQRMAAVSPLAPYPYTALSLVSATSEERGKAIERSHALAEHEGWQAKVRIVQALKPGMSVEEIGKADVQTILGSSEMSRWLAGYYLENLDLRPTIVAWVESAPGNLQSRFLSNVRNLSAQSN